MSSKRSSFLDDLNPTELAERLQLAVEGAGVGIWDWDLTTDSVHFDRRWCEMLGLDQLKTEMRLSTWDTLVHPDDKKQVYEDIRRYMAGETPKYENIHRLRHANGEWIYILDRGAISARDKEGKPTRFTGTHLDVTITEKARIVSEQDQKLLLRLINDMPAAMAMLDMEMKYLAASEKWLKDFSLKNIEYIGKSHYEIFPDIPQRWKEIHQKALRGEELSSDRDLFEREDGGRIWLRWTIRPWRKSNGGIGGIMMLTENITEQTEAAIALEHSAKMTALGEMASGIAHEINNPLTIIAGKSQVLELLLQDEVLDRTEVNRLAKSIRETVNRIALIVQGMRNISRDSTHNELVEVEMLNVIKDTINLCQGRLNKKEIKLTLPVESFKVTTNPVYVSQIILNLLNNSVDALAEVSDRWIKVSLLQEGSSIVVSVIDSGAMISPSLQTKIFQPFFTTKPPGEGTGLGLSVSQNLAKNIGASLKLDKDSPVMKFDLKFGV
jgi:PAS domain S-box-containing protein